MVREAHEEGDEEMTPIYECRICSSTIPSDDSAVYHNDSDACIEDGNYFCAPCFQERLESQLLPTCAGCGGQLLYPNDLRCRSAWASLVERDRMVAVLRDYCTRTTLPEHFHIALSPSEMATALSVNTGEETVRGLYDEVDNWFWLQEDLGDGADLGDTWTPTEIIEQEAVTLDELSFYHFWRLVVLLGVKAFRAM